MSLGNFQLLSRLGEGAYSSVYKVRRLNDGCEYALKKVRMLNLSSKEKENALNEVRILASIRNPNVIQYREAFLDEASQDLCIIMEFADSGDLFQKICEHQKTNTYFEENDIWKVFIQVVRGIRALHELNIMHRDLKSANVFLFKDSTAKLGDMNVSKVAKKGLGYTQTGTPYYASPEVWRDQPYDIKSDVWSLGCVLYENITLKPPFRAQDMASLYKKVIKGIYPRIPTFYSQDLAEMVKKLLHVSAHQRPSCEQILKLPAVVHRIEQLFPNDNFEEVERSALMSTIRIPRNIMYLSDKLPRPSYGDLELEDVKCRSTSKEKGSSLPTIPLQRRLKQRPPKHDRPRLGLEADDPLHGGELEGLRQYRVAKSKVKKPLYKLREDVGKRDASPGPEVENGGKDSPKAGTEGVEKEEGKRGSGRQLAAIMEESTKMNESPSRLKEYESPTGDQYLNQLLSKKNPVLKPHHNNIRRIANIYSNNYAEHIISMHKRKIDRILELNRNNRGLSKPRAKPYQYNIGMYLDANTKSIKSKVLDRPSDRAAMLQIPNPLKAVRILPQVNLHSKSPNDHLIKGIVGSRYIHPVSKSYPDSNGSLGAQLLYLS